MTTKLSNIVCVIAEFCFGILHEIDNEYRDYFRSYQ